MNIEQNPQKFEATKLLTYMYTIYTTMDIYNVSFIANVLFLVS